MTPRAVLDMFRRKGGARCIEIGRHIQTYLDDGLDPTIAAALLQLQALAAELACGDSSSL